MLLATRTFTFVISSLHRLKRGEGEERAGEGRERREKEETQERRGEKRERERGGERSICVSPSQCWIELAMHKNLEM